MAGSRRQRLASPRRTVTQPVFTVYSRPGCHLCEHLVEELLPLIRDRATLEVCNVDLDEDLRLRYGTRIPVLEYQGQLLSEYRLDRQAVLARLRELS